MNIPQFDFKYLNPALKCLLTIPVFVDSEMFSKLNWSCKILRSPFIKVQNGEQNFSINFRFIIGTRMNICFKNVWGYVRYGMFKKYYSTLSRERVLSENFDQFFCIFFFQQMTTLNGFGIKTGKVPYLFSSWLTPTYLNYSGKAEKIILRPFPKLSNIALISFENRLQKSSIDCNYKRIEHQLLCFIELVFELSSPPIRVEERRDRGPSRYDFDSSQNLERKFFVFNKECNCFPTTQ